MPNSEKQARARMCGAGVLTHASGVRVVGLGAGGAACPSQLTAPVLHKVLAHKAIQVHIPIALYAPF